MAPKFNAKHYEVVADLFRVEVNKSANKARKTGNYIEHNTINALVAEFIDTFRRDNPRFNESKFLAAVYEKEQRP